MINEELERFIEAWGSMGVLWGINRSMARVQAFVLLSEKPVDLDQVSKDLNISRGNASMCLKELRNWGVIHRVHVSGDRRDFYVAEPDIWKMFFKIAVERKKREFDPSMHALRHLIAESGPETGETVQERLTQMEEILSTIDGIMNKFLQDEKKSRTMLEFFKTFSPK